MPNSPLPAAAVASPEPGDDSPFYLSAAAHLLDELRWLNRLLAAEVWCLRRANFYDGVKDFRDFFIADGEIDDLLAAEVFATNDAHDDRSQTETAAQLLAEARRWRDRIDRRVENTPAQNIFLPLPHLCRCFHLNEFERQALLICLAPQIDGRYEKLYAYLQNDISKKAPSLGLILNLLCPTAEARLQALSAFHLAAPLRRYRLLEKVENSAGTSAAQHFLRTDARLVHYVLGQELIDERLLPHLRFFPPVNWQNVVVPKSLKRRLQKLWQNLLDDISGPRAVLFFHGRPGVGKKTIASALCNEMGFKLAVADLRTLPQAPENFAETVRLILREALLQPCVVYFEHLEILDSAEGELQLLFSRFAAEVRASKIMTFFGSEKPLLVEYAEALPVCAIEIPMPGVAEQKALWKMHVNGFLNKKYRQSFEQAFSQFNLTGGQIAGAVRLARQNACSQDSGNGHFTVAELVSAGRMQTQPKLAQLAQRITPVYGWDDIVLPEDSLAQLREICQRVKHRHRVFSEWGFGRKLSQGKGINALFAGPSGTGKTMAAEIIANELQLDLYKIDLSGVVSKYIGETEKNLDRIFAAAEHSNAILFFDEADALFGKRSEVRDAHDRYANIEISYLLQKMEQHEGITILATNLRQNLDDSFTRRLAFTIHFPFPDEESRRRIWKNIWPKEIPLAKDAGLDAFANQYKLSGGNIRNVALAAAFFAAEDGGIIKEAHLLHAIRREYQKLGKHVSETELANHFTKV